MKMDKRGERREYGEHSDSEIKQRGHVAVLPIDEEGEHILLYMAMDDETGELKYAIPSGAKPLRDGEEIEDAAIIELRHDMKIVNVPLERLMNRGLGAIFLATLPEDINKSPKREGRPAPDWVSKYKLPRVEEFLYEDQCDLVYDFFGMRRK